ncbi:MAG: hypothetical protein QOH36_1172 [Actinomycetota bacterium]|nr:hypothetical protein [Actinomycetota bacterium]MEA2971836.1 hypothetical protein [Actinomycetota bacterium]
MADQKTDDGANPDLPDQTPVVVVQDDGAEEEPTETISQPAKVLRIGAMTKELLEEVRRAELDDASRTRLKEIFETSVRELADGISPDLRDELSRLTLPFDSGIPSEAELRVAQAQLVGWLEGLFHGIQAAMFSQQAAMQAAQGGGGARGLPAGPGRPGPDPTRPGNYL